MPSKPSALVEGGGRNERRKAAADGGMFQRSAVICVLIFGGLDALNMAGREREREEHTFLGRRRRRSPRGR